MRVFPVMSAVAAAVMFGAITPNATAAVRVNPATCPASIQRLPADGVQHAADQALAAAAKLYPGINTKGAEVMAAARSAFAGVRGQQVTAMCGSHVAGRTVVVQMLFPAMLPSASLSQSVVFAGRFAGGYRVWFVAR
jgi:hypothetical protein